MRLRVLENPEELARAAAELVAEALGSGARTLVLAGGSTPQRTYELLAARQLEWGRVTVLFGDERCVPPDHPESNYAMARHILLGRVHPGSLHRVPAELGPQVGAQLYDPIVRSLSPLDLVLLGMGPDGHTASLFPGHPALGAVGGAVPVTNAPKPPPERVSLTLSALRQARRVVLLVSGADKAVALEAALEGTVPAGMIPHAECLADRAAAARALRMGGG